jgi:stage II sporulation protein D
LASFVVIGILAGLLLVGQSSADSGLTIHDSIRIGLYYGVLSLHSVRVSQQGGVNFFVLNPLGEKIMNLEDTAATWLIQREAIRLELGPYGSLAAAEQILARWPESIPAKAVVQQPSGFSVIGGQFLSVEQARQSIPALNALGLTGARVRGAEHLVTVLPLMLEEAEALRDKLYEAGIGTRLFFDGYWRVAAGAETDLTGINAVQRTLSGLVPEIAWRTQTASFKRVDVLRHDGKSLFTYENMSGMPLRLESEGILSIEGRQHRGTYEFILNTDNKFVVVSEMDIDDYLKSVVPREMPALWHLEALKAQSVVARTYTQANRSKHAHHGFDLCTFSSCCQAYGGVEWERENSSLAVDETRRQILFYNGRPALTFYHSDSGGHTEANANVWRGTPIPYLAGVPDPYPSLAGSTNSSWNTAFNQTELRNILTQNGLDVGTIVRLEVVERTEAGRVFGMVVHGTLGTATLVRQQPRLPNGSSGYVLRSTMYDVSNQIAPGLYVHNGTESTPLKSWQNVAVMTGSGITDLPVSAKYVLQGIRPREVSAIPTGFLFEGSGWGHGVGMSQWGARGMAEQGHSYDDILLHYYHGVELINVLP